MRKALFAVLAATLAACSPANGGASAPASSATKAVHPESGLTVVPLTITSASGVHRFKVEVAASMMEQARGLMFRTRLGPDEGMIFPMDPPRGASFWMKNTLISLDMIFADATGTVRRVHEGAVPGDASGFVRQQPHQRVLVGTPVRTLGEQRVALAHKRVELVDDRDGVVLVRLVVAHHRRVDQIAEPFLVVRFQLLTGPAPASFDGLDRVSGTDDLIELRHDKVI